MAGGIVGRLQAYLGLNTTQFEGGIKKSERDVKRFGQTVQTSLTGAVAQASGFGRTFATAMAGGLVTAAFAGISSNIEETIRGIASIGDEAKRAGMGVEEFQQWGFVAKQNRIEIDAVIDGFKEMNLRADEFITTGGGGGADAFKRLGFSASELSRRLEDPSELMLELMKRMEGLDTAGQIRVFDELLGGAGGERFVELLGQGETKIRATLQASKDLGTNLDKEAIEKAAELNRQFGVLQETIGTHLRQAVVDFGQDIVDLPLISFGDTEVKMQDLIDYAKDMQDRIENMGNAADTVQGFRDLQYEAAAASQELRDLADATTDTDQASMISTLADEMEQLAFRYNQGTIEQDDFAAKVQDVTTRATDAANALGDMDASEFDAVIGRLGSLGVALGRIVTLGQQATSAMPGPDDIVTTTLPPIPDVVGEFAPESSPRPQRPSFEASENMAYGHLDKGKGGGSGGGKSDKDKKDEFKSALASIKEETAALEAEAVALLAVTSAQQDYGDVVEYARRRAELMHAAQKDGMAITPELKRQIDDLARAYTTAGMNAEEAADRLQRIEEAGEKGADAITDIFLSLRNGADGFKDALKSLLLQIAQVQTQKAIMGGFGGLGGKGGAGAAGWIGNLLTLPGNAGGTQNWRGGITRINEIGGEIVDLPSGTRIIPHDVSKRMVADQVAAGGSSQNWHLTADLRGTTGDRELDRKLRQSAEETLRQVPGFMANHDKRRR